MQQDIRVLVGLEIVGEHIADVLLKIIVAQPARAEPHGHDLVPCIQELRDDSPSDITVGAGDHNPHKLPFS